MKFGPVPTAEAQGATVAHAVMAGRRKFKKGHRLTAADIAELCEAGIEQVTAAVLGPDDIGEDEAAARIAAALGSENVEVKPAATGRVNIHALAAGVFTVDRAMVDAINAVDPAITLATLGEFEPVEAGRMIATVKIIPFAVQKGLVEAAVERCAGGRAFGVQPYRPRRVALIQTALPGIKASVLDKTRRITEERLARSGSVLAGEHRPPHDEDTLAQAIGEAAPTCDLLLIFGASAVSDPDDVIPAAIRKVDGIVERFGMPVDPGNLLVLGRLGDKPVLGAPGCARSPRENGFDWVLDRLMADLPVSGRDIAAMGVGGLLMEIAERPQPRETAARARHTEVHAVVLAAGQSRRMGGPNKLLARFDGVPLVRRTAARVVASDAASTSVVIGHQGERITDALNGIEVIVIENHDYAAGLSTSLKAGIQALPAAAAGAMVVLADMPDLTTPDLNRLIAAFHAHGGRVVVRATHGGKRGNPVILPRSLFGAVSALEGDTGARHIVENGSVEVVDVEIGRAATMDVDTPDALHAAGGSLEAAGAADRSG
ncbi:NTP transferase domain-containing protein [Mesorhizobium xinjiangense]|uniref:NTP transferase domain-containing protein n=1 Tax=Mesorhizobium xinjiangense TaxID=2678685 RepID=UPI0012EE22D5|nr:molybdopterin-binding/glycosyltransferase family 2 protein [Mesorhizobium xinjiangense]